MPHTCKMKCASWTRFRFTACLFLFVSCQKYAPTFIPSLELSVGVDQLVFSKDSSIFVTRQSSAEVGRAKTANVWRVLQKQPIDTVSVGEEIKAMAVSDDGKVIFVCTERECFSYQFEPKILTGTYNISSMVAADPIVRAGIVPQNGSLWVMRPRRMTIVSFNPQNIQHYAGIFAENDGKTVLDVPFSSDGTKILFRDPVTGNVQVQTVEAVPKLLLSQPGVFRNAVFSNDSKSVVLVSQPDTGLGLASPISVIAVNLETKKVQKILDQVVLPSDAKTRVLTTPGNQVLEIFISASQILEIDLSSFAVNTRMIPSSLSTPACISQSGNEIIYGPLDISKSPSIFSSANLSGRNGLNLLLSKSPFVFCVFSPDGRYLAVPFSDGTGLGIWNVTGISL